MGEKKVTWLELFYDLIFVAAFSKSTHVLLHVEAGYIHLEYLLKFVLIFIPIWWAWVGQTMFINRFGEDFWHQRMFLILQMLFVLIMTSSLSVDFDQYYIPFLTGYVGLRVMTAVQYLVVLRSEVKGSRRNTAHYLGTRFWFGILISVSSLFFESWIRYAALYAGIIVEMIVPLAGRKHLMKSPTHTGHLLERFGLLTLILFGETVVSTLSVLQPQKGDWDSISFSILAFTLIVSIWWQYYDNVEKKVDKSVQTAGQTVIYGHLFILMSLSMIASSIQLLYLQEVHYSFILYYLFGSVFIYFIATSLVFHKYRYEHQRLKINHLGLFTAILAAFLAINLILVVPNIIILAQLTLFFIVYAKITTT
ncbi:low temperature requirement protein A [Paenibacillus zanthoxyli]|uniref:low temperature requirement protein A n=1 Tax=Paenibacillus zanthoxyli TaxID=369399 RepID=UPI0004712532|nr:low temperature requirement protein A [Paenibacillus zanthoxyli]